LRKMAKGDFIVCVPRAEKRLAGVQICGIAAASQRQIDVESGRQPQPIKPNEMADSLDRRWKNGLSNGPFRLRQPIKSLCGSRRAL
jgi:hypothetical protein